MSLSLLHVQYLGGPQVFPTNFALGVLEPEHLFVTSLDRVDGLGEPLVLAFAYDDGTGDVHVSTPLVLNERLLIKRTVPKTSLYVEFVSADITPQNVDNTIKQAMMAVHEVLDQEEANRAAVQTVQDGLDALEDGGLEQVALAQAAAAQAILAAERAEDAVTDIDAELGTLAGIARSGSASDLSTGTLPGARFTDASHGNRGGAALHAAATQTVNGFMSAADKAKLDGVAAGATANSPNATLLNRANHTGTQLASTISDFAFGVSTATRSRSPEDFGAVGNGIADDSPAIGAWLDFLLANPNTEGVLLPVSYRMNTAVVREVSQAVTLSIRGMGGRSRFYIPPTNTTGGIILQSLNRQCRGYFRDFDIIRGGQQADAGGIGGTAFAFRQLGYGITQGHGVICENVNVRLEDGDGITINNKRFDVGLDFSGNSICKIKNSHYHGPSYGLSTYAQWLAAWGSSVALKLTDVSYPILEDVFVSGWGDAGLADSYVAQVTSAASNGAGGTRIFLSNPPRPFSAGQVMRGFGVPAAYQNVTVIPGGSFSSFDVAVPFTSTFTGTFVCEQQGEAFIVRGGGYNKCRRGFVFERNTREPTGWITNAHFNTYERSVRLNGARFINITDCSFYNEDAAGGFAGGNIDIDCPDISDSIIRGNIFTFAGHPSRRNIVIGDNGTAESGDRNIVNANIFRSGGLNAVVIAAGTNGNQVSDNIQTGIYTKPYEMNNTWGFNGIRQNGGRDYSNLNTLPDGDLEGRFGVAATNKPGAANSAGTFTQRQFADGDKTQTAHLFFPAVEANRIYVRVMVAGVWGAWAQL